MTHEKLYVLTVNVDTLNRGAPVTRSELQAELDTWECDGQWIFHATHHGNELHIRARRLGDHNEEPPFDFDWQVRNIFNYRVVVGERAYRCPTNPHVQNCGFDDMIAHAEFGADEDFARGYPLLRVWAEGEHIYLGREVYAYAMTEEHRK